MQKLLKKTKKLLKSQPGQVLNLTLIMMLLGIMLIIPLLALMATGLKTGKVYEQKTNLLYAADAGIEDATWQLKYDHFEDLVAGYSPYDFENPFEYDLTDPDPENTADNINNADVAVTVKNVWLLPDDFDIPDIDVAEELIEGSGDNPPKMIISSKVYKAYTETLGYGVLEIDIQYYPEIDDDLKVESLGIWLPRGFEYYEGTIGEEETPEEANKFNTLAQSDYQDYLDGDIDIGAHKSGTAIQWYFSYLPVSEYWPYLGDSVDDVSPFPGVDTSGSEPYASTIYLPFTAEEDNLSPQSVCWIKVDDDTDLVTDEDIHFTWDANVRIYHITSISTDPGTLKTSQVEAWVAKNQARSMSTAIEGDYFVTGNTFIWNKEDDSYNVRDAWLNSDKTSSNTVTEDNIPENASVELAYLYWSAWLNGKLFEDECDDFGNWDSGSCWNIETESGGGHGGGSQNKYFSSHYSSGDDSTRYMTLKSQYSVDLDGYSSGDIALSWEQWVAELSSSDHFFYDDCSNYNLTTYWINGEDWSFQNGQANYRGKHNSANSNDARYLTLTSRDLTPYGTSGDIDISWTVSRGNQTQSTDGLNIAYTLDGSTWITSQVFLGNSGTPVTSISLSNVEYTDNFQIRFYLVGYAASQNQNNRYCAVDNITIDIPAYTSGYSDDDGLYFSLSGDGGTTWSDNLEAFTSDIGNEATTFSYTIPDEYLVDDFSFRFYLAGFGDDEEYCYIDNISIKTSNYVPDTNVTFEIDGRQVYFDGEGEPQEGDDEQLTADRSEVIINNVSGEDDGYSYSCFKDVTDLLLEYCTTADDAENIPGWGEYTIGKVNVSVGSTEPYQLSYAGWSLIIIYSSPDTLGHQLYLYDRFSFADDYTDLDFDKDGNSGGTIRGFYVPEKISGETVAAKITVFVGEGDNFGSGVNEDYDFIAFNAPELYWDGTYDPSDIPDNYKLWDGVATDRNSSTSPNNAWNGESTTLSTDGIDIDTFEVAWNRTYGKLEEGDTSAHIDIYTEQDNWNLIYIIMSFRSKTTTGGAMSYLIHGVQ